MPLKILFIAPHPPAPPNTGPRHYLYGLLKYASSYYQCEIIGYAQNQEEFEEWKRLDKHFPEIRLLDVVQTEKGINKLVSSIVHFLSMKPLAMAAYKNKRINLLLEKTLVNKDYDIIHLLSFHLSHLHTLLSPFTTLLTVHNAYSLGYLRAYNTFPWTINLPRLRYLFLYHAFLNLEKRVYSKFTLINTVSKVDTNYLKKAFPGLRVTTIPIPIGEEFLERKRDKEQRGKVIFVMGLFSNDCIAQGAVEFLENFCSFMREGHLSTRIVLWSRTLLPKVQKRMNLCANVQHISYVEDYIGFLDQATVCVFPQRCDSGIQVKVQQAMARGIPVVGSNEVLAGLQITHNIDAMAYSKPNQAGPLVSSLLNDNELAHNIGQAGRLHIAREFSLEKVGQELNTTYKTALEIRQSHLI